MFTGPPKAAGVKRKKTPGRASPDWLFVLSDGSWTKPDRAPLVLVHTHRGALGLMAETSPVVTTRACFPGESCPGSIPATPKSVGSDYGIVPARQAVRSSSTGKNEMNPALTSSADVMPPGTRRPRTVVQPALNHLGASTCAGFEQTVQRRAR